MLLFLQLYLIELYSPTLHLHAPSDSTLQRTSFAILFGATDGMITVAQDLLSTLFKRLYYHAGNLGRNGLAEETVCGACELDFYDKADFRSRGRWVRVRVSLLRRLVVWGQGLERILLERPSREEGGEE